MTGNDANKRRRELRVDTQGRLFLAPFTTPAAVTPSDSTDLPGGACSGLVAAGAGAVKIDTANATGVTLQIAAGVMMPVAATRVYSTGTTATGIVALYP